MIWFGNLNSLVHKPNFSDNNKAQLAREKGWTALNQGQYHEAKKQFDLASRESLTERKRSGSKSGLNTLSATIQVDQAILSDVESLAAVCEKTSHQSAEYQIADHNDELTTLTELALTAEEDNQQGLAASYWMQVAKNAKSKLPTGERDGLFALALANTSLGVLDAPLRKMAKNINEADLDKADLDKADLDKADRDKAVSLEFLDKTYFEGQYLSRIGRNEESTSTLKKGLDDCLFMPYEHRAAQTMVALYRHYKERKQFYESYDLAVDGPAFVREEATPSLVPQEMLNSKSLKAVYLAQLADYYNWLLKNPDRTREMLAANPALAAEMRNKDFKTEMNKAALGSLLLTETGEAQNSGDPLKLRTSNILNSKALFILCTQPENKSFLALKLACALTGGTADSVINSYCELARSESANSKKSDALMKCATEQLTASSGQIVWLSDSSLDAFARFAQTEQEQEQEPPHFKIRNTVAAALQASAEAAEEKYGKNSLQHCLQLRALGRFWLSLNPEKASAPLVQAWNVVRVSKTFPLAARHDILEEYLEMLRKTGKTADATKLEPLLQALTEL